MSDRRELQGTDSSWTSSFADALQQNLQLEDKLLREENETPQEKLQRLLSTRSVISTSSSFAERQQAAVGLKSPFREIGTGSIGKIFEQPGTPWAFKVLIVDRTDKLWNNYAIHLKVQQSFDRLGNIPGPVEVPRVSWFASKDSERPREILCMERIMPLPQPVRHALIDIFCNPNNAQVAKSDPLNKDCLIRLLLGRKRFGSSRPGRSMSFSLRNYKLHVDQIQDIKLDADEYARGMADALAVLHWHAKIDAMDVEFVLGSSPIDQNAVRREMHFPDIQRLCPGTSTFEQTTNTSPNFKKRMVSLWLLDFDACTSITMNTAGVQQAAKAFMENDPYYPRPYSNDDYMEHLWQIFSHSYVATAKKITARTTWQSLPGQFIQEIQSRFLQRAESTRSGDNRPTATSNMSLGRGESSQHRGRPISGQSRRARGEQRGTRGGRVTPSNSRTRGSKDQRSNPDEHSTSPRSRKDRGRGRR
ncbi:hypothetical protein BO85DRAFT_467281 [Aspergillus piperis CBS 112811]|uniref:DUF3669 domain-containing protein n=1 Tax=Aspergillus piperis CBS 112811 TaxID=1448313 RepID=A0A8G1VR78_9EURO|nr:hypothetical protein BO85DRAFT_467281 [Aspergillus piperis CBS 112811]RAH59513.1 hypothetical protein BO85DRAFT_467281 [Aspergillus piperis CBS 112811]